MFWRDLYEVQRGQQQNQNKQDLVIEQVRNDGGLDSILGGSARYGDRKQNLGRGLKQSLHNFLMDQIWKMRKREDPNDSEL